MKPGDIVLAAFQQEDSKVKKRPALILSHVGYFQDLILCGISTQLWVAEHDPHLNVTIAEDHPDFAQSGLKAASVFRLGFLYTMSHKHIQGKMGMVSDTLYRDFINRLVEHLEKN